MDPTEELSTASSAVPRLSIVFNPKSNAVGFLRLFAAGLVLFSHSFHLAGQPDPLQALSDNQATLGGLAVTLFFVLSGFLITRSLLHSRTSMFLWRRALRILPGYWVCLIVTAVGFGGLLWWHSHGTIDGFWGAQNGPGSFIEHNWLVMIRQWDVAGVTQGNPISGINGSLWTLINEVRCYVVIAVLGAAGVIRLGRSPVLIALAAFWWLASLAQVPVDTGQWFPISDTAWAAHSLAFTLGALAYIYADRILMTNRGALVAAGVAGGVLFSGSYSTFGIFPVAYLVLFLAAKLPFHRLNTKRDLSYGVYIYAFPVQQTLVVLGVHRAGVLPLAVLAAAGVTVLALLSWQFIEKPALRYRPHTIRSGPTDYRTPWRRPWERRGRRRGGPPESHRVDRSTHRQPGSITTVAHSGAGAMPESPQRHLDQAGVGR